MEKIELAEKLRARTGLSLEEDWDALEKNNWVLVDAMLWLETEGKIPSQTATATSTDETSYQPVHPTITEKKASDSSLWDTVKRLLGDSLTHHLVLQKDGGPVLRLPVLILLLLLCAAFYVVVAGLLAALFCGCQFSLEGPKVKPDNELNRVMKEAEDAAAKMKNERKD